MELESEWEAGALGLAGDRRGEDGAGAVVEDIVAEHEDGTAAGLLGATRRAQVGPADVAP